MSKRTDDFSSLAHVVLVGKDLERRLNDTTTETEDKVESGLLLDVYGSVDALIPSNRSLVRSSILRLFRDATEAMRVFESLSKIQAPIAT